MLVERAYLKNYRNLKAVLLDFNSDINIILGANGQGKTNLLEALYYLSTGKSHRTSRDTELINKDDEVDEFVVQARIKKKEELVEKLAVAVSAREKIYRVNDDRVERMADFLGRLNAVIFSPEDLKLVKGSPSQRRDFLDTEVSQVSPSYYEKLKRYEKILRQRNNLLKDIRAGRRKKGEMLAVFTEELTRTGSKIIAKRLEVVEKLKILARLQQRKLTENQENLKIEYELSFAESRSTSGGSHSSGSSRSSANSNPKKAKDLSRFIADFEGTEEDRKALERVFRQELNSNLETEIERGYTLAGPHRDDLCLTLNDFDVRKYGSQGQQRTVALALKLSELEFMKSEQGEYPVLLLDDVFSELDRLRRQAVVDLIGSRIQTFITTTDKELVRDIAPEKEYYFRVDRGRITRGW